MYIHVHGLVPLISVTAHSTQIFTLYLLSPFPSPFLSHLFPGHEIERDYTPIKSFGSPSSSSSIKLMIKLYSDGAMSQYLSKLKKGNESELIRLIKCTLITSRLWLAFS